jgi:signal transduction histidine kinase
MPPRIVVAISSRWTFCEEDYLLPRVEKVRETSARSTILIVDDIPSNITILAEVLEKQHDVSVATNGPDALDIINKKPPDLILLDVVMPGMDGYEICEQLKAQESTREIPVIFVTAKNDPWDESKGLELGAVDFITKPVRPQIVKARVKTHLELKKQKDILKSYTQKLEQRVEDRTHELQVTINLLSQEIDERKLAEQTAVRNARLASLGTLAAGVAHEINNPNNAIGFASATLIRLWQDFIPHLNEYRKMNGEFHVCGLEVDEGMETMSSLVVEVGKNTKRIASIVTNLKQMTRGNLENLEQKVDVNTALKSAVEILKNVIKNNTDHFSMDLGEDLPPIKGNTQQLEQVFINLIQNALESLPNRKKGVEIITAKHPKQQNNIAVHIQDHGVGINGEYMDLITKPFYTTKGDEGGTGLGLSISKTILNNHRGSLTFKSKPEEGTTATVQLPIASSHDEEDHDEW